METELELPSATLHVSTPVKTRAGNLLVGTGPHRVVKLTEWTNLGKTFLSVYVESPEYAETFTAAKGPQVPVVAFTLRKKDRWL